MEPRANYFIVGLFVISLVVVTVLGIVWLSDSQRHHVYHLYLTYMNESVAGLSVQAPVKFNGVNVGIVQSIKIDPKDPQQVRLLLSIQDGTPINQSTRAILMTQSITGVMFVGLKAGAVVAPPLEIPAGEKHPVIPAEPSVLMELGTALRTITDDMHGISNGFQQLLGKENQKAITDSLKNLDITLRHSQDALRDLTQQALPSLVGTANRFDTILNRMEPFITTLQDNPSALVRGKLPNPPGPGE